MFDHSVSAFWRASGMLGQINNIFGRKEWRRSTLRNIAWNYVGYLYNIAINFGVTSYIVRHIAVAEYGLYLFVFSLSTTLYLMDIGISYLLIQAYIGALEHEESSRLNDLISTSFLALSALGSLGMFIFAGLASLLPGPFNIPHQYLGEAVSIFLIFAVVMQVKLPSIAVEQVYQASHRFDRINQIQLLSCTVNAALSLVVIDAGFRIVTLAVVQLFVVILQLLLFTLALPSSVPHARLSLARFKWSLLKPLIRLSKWAFVHNLSMYIFDFLTWTILASLGSLREAAMFGIASKMPRQLWSLVDRGANVLLPLLVKSAAKGDQVTLQKTYLRAQRLIVGALLPFVVLGCIFARPLLRTWAGPQYMDATPVMQWLLLSAIAQAVAYPSDELLYACGQIKKVAAISISGGITSIVGALLLIPHYGAAGLAAAMAMAQLLINFGWFTLAGCKVLHISPWALLKEVSRGLRWPLVLLTAETALVSGLSSRLSPLWLVIAAFLCGCFYMVIWGFYTALPLYRNQPEIVA